MVKPGAVVVAAGVSFEGKKIVSDVADDVAEVAGVAVAPHRRGRPDDPGHAAVQHRRRRRAPRRVSGADTFAGATAVRPDPDVAGRWHADIPPGWSSPGGIHGGVLAATILRRRR